MRAPDEDGLTRTTVVIAKSPVPGRVKTRLCPPCTPAQAAALAAAAIADTLTAVDGCACERRVLALDGAPGSWVPPGWDVVPQSRGGLGERLDAAVVAADSPVLVLGMDTPQITASLLDAAWAQLLTPGTDAVLGPARDGGYWTIGVRVPRSGLFEGVEMSTAHTGRHQIARLCTLGLRVTELDELRDVDTIVDAHEVARAIPCSHFAVALAETRRGVTVIAAPARLCTVDGRVLDLPAHRWFAAASVAEQRALDHAEGPALDIGCGPGRHLVALAERNVFALGIDISDVFLDVARGHGVNVLQRSVFGHVPGARRWRTALLFDGNIGIGGDPVALLSRVVELLRDDGRIIVEIEPDDPAHEIVVVRAETADQVGPWFRWTSVGLDRLSSIAGVMGLEVVEAWDSERRRFAVLAVRR